MRPPTIRSLSLLSSFSLLLSNGVAEEAPKDLGALWFIGDSITQSNADSDPQGSPRKALFDLLKEHDYTFSFTGHHAKNVDGLPDTGSAPKDNLYHFHSGVSGILVGDEKRRGIYSILDKEWSSGRLAEVKPDKVLIMLGTNDVGHGYELAEAPQRVRALLDKIYALPDAGNPEIFLGSIPPNRRNEADKANVLIFNEALPLIVDEYRKKGKEIHFVDHFTPIDNAYEKSMRGDNLHPNGEGNKLIGNAWFQAIQKAGGSEVTTSTTQNVFPGEKTDFHGFDMYTVRLDNKYNIKIVAPEKPAEGKPWLWRSLFWEAIGRVRDADLQLVKEGYHVVLAHGHVAGHPSGNACIDAAYNYVTTEHGFAKKMNMSSMSRGTLSLFRWASSNPEKVASIYVDNGVLNTRSWPAGSIVPGNESIANGAPDSWKGFKKAFGFATDEEALNSKESPIDLLEPLAKAGVPILSVCGDSDPAVPYEENDAVLEERYKKLGGDIKVIVEKKGHSHGMKDPTPVLEFIRATTGE